MRPRWHLPASQEEAGVEDRAFLRAEAVVSGSTLTVYDTYLATPRNRRGAGSPSPSDPRTSESGQSSQYSSIPSDHRRRFNSSPPAPDCPTCASPINVMKTQLLDVWPILMGNQERSASNTIIGLRRRIDYIFTDSTTAIMEVSSIMVDITPESDHASVIADL